MNLYMKIGEYTNIAHCTFEDILIEELKNEHELVSKLKKIAQINFINNSRECFVKSNGWDIDKGKLFKHLHAMNFKAAVIWFDGSWASQNEFDTELLKCMEEWGDNWLCAGHIIDRLESAKAPKWHKQCIVINLKRLIELELTELSWNQDHFPGFIPSEECIHDNYTPLYLQPVEKTYDTLDFYGDEFDALIPIALNNNLYVHNLPYAVRNNKYCCYPEDDIEHTKKWLLDPDWGKRPDAREFYFSEIHEDKRELYGFKMMGSDIMYITNTENVPDEREMNIPIEVMAVPCSGLSQFKHMTNAIDTLEKVVWFDFNEYSNKWMRYVLNHWDGKNFRDFVSKNRHKIVEWGFHNDECIIYEEESVQEFEDSWDNEEQWLEYWDKIKKLEHVILNIDIVRDNKGLINSIGTDKNVFLQTSNIWSYEINYMNTKGFTAQTSFLNLINDLMVTNKNLYFTGDTTTGFYHSYVNIKQMSGIL